MSVDEVFETLSVNPARIFALPTLRSFSESAHSTGQTPLQDVWTIKVAFSHDNPKFEDFKFKNL